MILATKTRAQMDRVIEQKQGDGFREHMGASLIGKECGRYIWYKWRWAKKTRAGARLLRLWDRGNKEEERFIQWLRQSGTHVEALDVATGKQFRIEDHAGHFGGSRDARLFDSPDFPGEWVLGEFKTFADKYFKELKKVGVEKAQFGYFVQMQIYMHYAGLLHALFFAINKNDDDLHVEIIDYKPEVAQRYIDRAGVLISMQTPPERINESPGWWQCGMCDMKEVCHLGQPKEKNCRTCVHSRPIDNAGWICTKFNYVLSVQEQRRGCTEHQMIPE